MFYIVNIYMFNLMYMNINQATFKNLKNNTMDILYNILKYFMNF